MMTKKLVAQPGSKHFGSTVEILNSNYGRGMALIEDGDIVPIHWLKDPQYPYTHPAQWAKLVDLSSKDRLLDDLTRVYWRMAGEESRQAFGDCDPDTEKNAKNVIYDVLSSGLSGMEDEFERDYHITLEDVLCEGD